jgi:hypothetical protein
LGFPEGPALLHLISPVQGGDQGSDSGGRRPEREDQAEGKNAAAAPGYDFLHPFFDDFRGLGRHQSPEPEKNDLLRLGDKADKAQQENQQWKNRQLKKESQLGGLAKAIMPDNVAAEALQQFFGFYTMPGHGRTERALCLLFLMREYSAA